MPAPRRPTTRWCRAGTDDAAARRERPVSRRCVARTGSFQPGRTKWQV